MNTTTSQSHGDLTELINDWTAGYRRTTRDGYQRDIQTWLTWCHQTGLDPLGPGVNRRKLTRYADWLAETPNPRTRRGVYSPASQARLVNTVLSFYRFATHELELYTENPVEGARKPRGDMSVARMSPVTEQDRRAILTTATQARGPHALRNRAILTILAYTGIRASELCNLTMGDYQWRGTRHGWVRVLLITGKGGKTAHRRCPPPVVDAVDMHQQHQAALCHTTVQSLSGPLFTTADGDRLTRTALWELVRRVAHKAGVPHRISPHSFRAGYITSALDAGQPLNQLQTDAMHSSPATTERYDRARDRIDHDASMVLYRIDTEGAA